MLIANSLALMLTCLKPLVPQLALCAAGVMNVIPKFACLNVIFIEALAATFDFSIKRSQCCSYGDNDLSGSVLPNLPEAIIYGMTNRTSVAGVRVPLVGNLHTLVVPLTKELKIGLSSHLNAQTLERFSFSSESGGCVAQGYFGCPGPFYLYATLLFVVRARHVHRIEKERYDEKYDNDTQDEERQFMHIQPSEPVANEADGYEDEDKYYYPARHFYEPLRASPSDWRWRGVIMEAVAEWRCRSRRS